MHYCNYYCIIMAGGAGRRFWPYSRKTLPKQFLDFFGTGQTLLQQTFERYRQIVPLENIYITTHTDYKELVRDMLPEVDDAHIIAEEERRNTAPSIAYASHVIEQVNPHATVVVAPCDHLILKTEEFKEAILKGLGFAERNDKLLTIGINPSRPETGYGYIKADLTMSSLRQREIFRVDKFKEKPDYETAKRYIQENDYFWNAGIFIWSVSTIVNAFRVYQPAISKIFEKLLPHYNTPDEQALIDQVYPSCESISVDYAIMEKAEEIFVCPADFGWSDLGTWGSLQMHSKRDLYGNTLIGEHIDLYDCHNCIVHTLEEKRVVVQGLDNYIIAEKDDTLLICRLDEEQRIRQFSDEK